MSKKQPSRSEVKLVQYMTYVLFRMDGRLISVKKKKERGFKHIPSNKIKSIKGKKKKMEHRKKTEDETENQLH